MTPLTTSILTPVRDIRAEVSLEAGGDPETITMVSSGILRDKPRPYLLSLLSIQIRAILSNISLETLKTLSGLKATPASV